MDLEIRFRNNDLAPQFPTFQERVNAMLPTPQGLTAAAPALSEQLPTTPRSLNVEEAAEALAQVESNALQQGESLLEVHAGLNAQRVAKLLGLLE
jgi:hypothetical protein